MSQPQSRSGEDCRGVLTELLRLFDWRNEIGRVERDFNHDRKQVKTWLNQYGREKKVAWEAARRALNAAASETSPTLLEVCEALFGCHVSPGHDEYGETEYRCAECEEKLDIKKWVTAEHSASCLINRVRQYLAVHKPQCVPGVKP